MEGAFLHSLQTHICRHSRCGAEINLDAVPLSDAAQALRRSDAAGWPDIIAGGDDYELAFTLPPDGEEEVMNISEEVGVTIPVVVRLEGNNAELGTKKLAESGLAIIAATSLTDAAQQVVKAAGGN